MKILSGVATIIVAIITLTFDVNPVKALEVYQQGSLLFSDSFSSSTITGWNDEIGTGGWSINNGNLLGVKTSTLQTGRLTNASVWDNYSIEVDINNNSGIDEGVGFRRSSLNSTYEVTLRHGTGIYNTPEIKLVKTQNGITSVLKSVTSTPLINQVWYHLKIESVKEHIQVWLDSNLIMDIDDPGTEVKTGGVSLSFWTGDYGISIVRFDNVKVNSLSKKLNPVIFIPGIGGSEFKANQDIIWSKDDGHNGTYSHAYTTGEKVWVNEEEAAKLGDDDYFDVLKLKTDGQTPEADVTLTGNLTPFGYPDIDNFFTNLGYEKNKTYFVYPYDWRKDITTTKQGLDDLVELAKQKSGMAKVNIVAHSMGGLVARYYIADPSKASKVNKLIELGVPHLGSVKALKTLMYGTWLARDFYLFKLGITPSETRDVFQNFPSAFQLVPSSTYYSFYNNKNTDLVSPFFDERDIDQDKTVGPLNYNQIKSLLSNLSYNTSLFNFSEYLQSILDYNKNTNNDVKLYYIVGSAQPTLGQVKDSWWIKWPINLFPKYDEVFINGDETVPLFSASLKSDSIDLSANAKIYYTQQKHTELVDSQGAGMLTVKAILNEGDAIPIEVHSEKITLEGEHISVDQDANLDLYDEDNHHTGIDSYGTLETNIPNTFFDNLGDTKHAFVKKSAKKVKVKVSSPKTKKSTPTVKIRRYSNDKISKTTLYNKISITDKTTVEFEVDPTVSTAPVLTVDGQNFPPTSEVLGDGTDYTPPTTTATITGSKDSSGNYSGGVSIVLTGTDNNSGILNTEYSLDNGTTVQTYTSPITVTTNGSNQIIVKSTDKLGNEEIPQTISFNITSSDTGTSVSTSTIETPTPTPTTTTSSSSDNSPTSSPTPSPTISLIPTYVRNITPTPIIIKLTKNDFPPGYSKILDPLPVNDILGEKIKKEEVKPAIIQPPPLLLFGIYILITLLFPTVLLTFRLIHNSDLKFSDIRKYYINKSRISE